MGNGFSRAAEVAPSLEHVASWLAAVPSQVRSRVSIERVLPFEAKSLRDVKIVLREVLRVPISLWIL